MANTVADLITEAMLDLNAIAPAETITTAEQTDAFMRLNQMLATWSNEQAMVYKVYHQSFALTAALATYTVGTAGSMVSTADPVRITGAAGVSGNFRSPCKLLSFDQFEAQVNDGQSTTAILPSVVAADNAYPSINIKVWPTPSAGGNLLLDYWAALTAFSAVSDVISMPPGYENAIQSNLALLLYPQYGTRTTDNRLASIAAMAKSSKDAIIAKNAAIFGMGQQAA